jgi:hypothetical protein
MSTIHSRRSITALWGLVGLLSAFNLCNALWGRTAHRPEAWSQLLIAASGVLLAVTAILFAGAPRRRAMPFCAGIIASLLAIWGMLAR